MSNLEAQLNEANQYIELLEQDKKTAMEKATGLEQQLAAEKEEHEEEMERVNQAIIVNSDGENMAPPTFRQMQVLAATGNQNHTLTYMPQQTTNDHSTQYYSTNDYSTTTTNINNGVSLEVLQGTLKGMLQELSRTINQNTHQVVQGSAQQTHQEIKDATRETKRHVQILSGRKPAAEGRRVSRLGSFHTPKNFESLYSGDVLGDTDSPEMVTTPSIKHCDAKLAPKGAVASSGSRPPSMGNTNKEALGVAEVVRLLSSGCVL